MVAMDVAITKRVAQRNPRGVGLMQVVRATSRFGLASRKTDARLGLWIPNRSRQAKGRRVRAAIWAAWSLLRETCIGPNHYQQKCGHGLYHMCLQTVHGNISVQAYS